MTLFRLVLAGGITCLAIYLFVSAPPPLAEGDALAAGHRNVEVERIFHAVNAVNESARQIYTSRIVGAGLKEGLKFGEDWADPGIDKGPLPALFLRLAAQRLEAKPTRLGLYLGSNAPINKSNLFSDAQSEAFEKLELTRAPVFSELNDGMSVGMFPDVASALPCVSCHNDHPNSPKKDWKMDDIMGATTWTYPGQILTADEYLDTTEQMFLAIEEAYGSYLDKVESFDADIVIGSAWPDEAPMSLPDKETFMREVRAAASKRVVEELILTTKSLE